MNTDDINLKIRPKFNNYVGFGKNIIIFRINNALKMNSVSLQDNTDRHKITEEKSYKIRNWCNRKYD